jgi:hypothetical protein
MWQVENRTPFAAERGWARDRDGSEVWLVAVKCTFDIRADGSTAVSTVQPPVLRMPEYNGEPGKSSIKYESDLVLNKRTTDVLVVGNAHAPAGRPVMELDVGFRIGSVTKLLRVFGNRYWGASGWSAPRPFAMMPLVYERAFGGVDVRSDHPERDWDWRNPVGIGYAVKESHLDQVPMPNIEHPNALIRSWRDRPAPAGFGAIAGHWQPRVAYAGTYDERWLQTRQPLVPDDFDDRFHQCAPADQQPQTFLRGGEQVILHHLTPAGDLRFVLPKLYLGFETRFYDGARVIHKSRKLHTVVIEPDFPRVSLVWHTGLSCHFKVQKLERTIVTLKTDVGSGSGTTHDDEIELELG